MHAEFFQKVKWKSVEAELYTLTNQTTILSEVFERLEDEANKNGMTKLRESLPLWGWLATLFGTSGLLALLYFTGCCCGHHCRNHLRRMIVKTQEGEDELWESITELKEQGRINLNSLSEKVSLLTGQIDQIHVRMDSELPSARKIPARKKLETPKSTEFVNIRANPGLGGLQFSPGNSRVRRDSRLGLDFSYFSVQISRLGLVSVSENHFTEVSVSSHVSDFRINISRNFLKNSISKAWFSRYVGSIPVS